MVFAGIVVVLLSITLVASTLFIYFFSTPEASHFYHNLAGVFVAASCVIFVLNKSRHHPFMFEVVYVWDLKQQLNRIYRKQHKLEVSVEENDHDAMIIMKFMYHGSKQLYQLDDNTITMGSLLGKIRLLDERIEAAGLDLSKDSYNADMLDRF